MIFKFCLDVFVQSVALFLFRIIYKKIVYTSFNFFYDIVLPLLSSFALKICFVYLSNNRMVIGVCIFLIFILLSSPLKRFSQAIYFGAFMVGLIFYIEIMLKIRQCIQINVFSDFYFSDYIWSLWIVLIISLFMSYVFKINFLLPDGKIRIFVLSAMIPILIIELILFDQFNMLFVKRNTFLLIYFVIGLIFFSNNIIIQYLYNDFHQLTIMSQNNFLSKITDSYIQGIHNEQEKVFKIRHDIKNNLIILQHLINNNQIAEANQVIDEINNHLKYKKSEVYTGNIFIDAYLTNVIINSQIDIQIKCNDLNDLHYKPDVIAIIINLVDNAVENANHLVNIQIKRKNPNSILIKVSNDCEHDPSKHLKKSKKQGDHGYGLRIVKDVVNQYQGTYLTSYQNGMFTTYVMLNLGENDEK
ncbi:GHKL domain-containing protein [[Clostridium] spiroforme]|nr:GHKL domain-containing protein [Thomasclavelia spiroformis]